MERFTSKIKELKKKRLVFNENIGKTKDNDNFAVIVYSVSILSKCLLF